MTVTADVQTLEPGPRIILYDLDAQALGGDLVHFHAHQQSSSIWWKGIEYKPWPIKAEGFAQTTDQPPQPKLTVGNVDGSISSLCLYFNDLVGATLTVHETFGKYLDAVNFPEGNPTADPTQEFPAQVWQIERKSSETRIQVEFELKSPMDIGQAQLPGRDIIANVCGSIAIGGYRGPECGYTGGPVADINDQPTDDPARDMCSGTTAGCKLRNWPNNELPYGSFPAAGLVRT